MKKAYLVLTLLFVSGFINGQISGSLMQHPDVSDAQITFVYGDDMWIASKSGGDAHPLSSPDGAERYPRFLS